MLNGRCLDCNGLLKAQKSGSEVWYSCNNCNGALVSVKSLSAVVSEYEFNKFKSEIVRAQIQSNKCCPLCTNAMIKILDLVRINEVEACGSCWVYWLNANEGAKIMQSQVNENNRDKRIDLNLQSTFSPSPSQIVENLTPTHQTIQGREFNNMFGFLLRLLGVDLISQKHPVLAFFLMIIVLIISVFILIKFGHYLLAVGVARSIMGG